MVRASTIAICLVLSACAAQVPGSDSNEQQTSASEALKKSRVRLCRPEKCGPPLGLPNTLCSDGKTVAGPTGRCIVQDSGTCGWEVISCPPTACPSSASCPKDEYCTVEDGDCNPAPGCRPGRVCPALCYGVCKPRPPSGPFCGGIAGIPCPGMGRCADNPNDSCDPNNGGADCGGICSCIDTVLCVQGSHFDSDPTVCACVPDAPRGPFCGGIAGIPCPGMGRCADDPTDDCDPNNGGADCGGICSCIQNVLCVRGSHFDSDPNVCTCVPDAGVKCGNRTCGAGQICCSPSCGICGSAGGFCPQIACVNPLP